MFDLLHRACHPGPHVGDQRAYMLGTHLPKIDRTRLSVVLKVEKLQEVKEVKMVLMINGGTTILATFLAITAANTVEIIETKVATTRDLVADIDDNLRRTFLRRFISTF